MHNEINIEKALSEISLQQAEAEIEDALDTIFPGTGNSDDPSTEPFLRDVYGNPVREGPVINNAHLPVSMFVNPGNLDPNYDGAGIVSSDDITGIRNTDTGTTVTFAIPQSTDEIERALDYLFPERHQELNIPELDDSGMFMSGVETLELSE